MIKNAGVSENTSGQTVLKLEGMHCASCQVLVL